MVFSSSSSFSFLYFFIFFFINFFFSIRWQECISSHS
jgi:hypothetical protein